MSERLEDIDNEDLKWNVANAIQAAKEDGVDMRVYRYRSYSTGKIRHMACNATGKHAGKTVFFVYRDGSIKRVRP